MQADQPSPSSPSSTHCTPAAPPRTSCLTLTPLSPGEVATASSAPDDLQLAQDYNEQHDGGVDGSEDVLLNTERGSDSGEEEDDEEEPDDSNDEDWSEEEASDQEEDVIASAESAESTAEEEEDLSINLIEVDLQQKVSALIRGDTCERRCLEGKAREIEWLVCSLSQMERSERVTCIHTMLALLMQTDTVERRRGKGKREKFHYYLPFIGQVCRPSFASCLGVTPLTVQRYKQRVRDGNIAAKAHGNTLNKHAAKVDVVWLVKWFQKFAEEVGEVVPVRVRLQKTTDGKVTKYYSRENYTMLPANFTRDAIYDEMHTYVEQIRLRVREPARSTMRKLLTVHCPMIRIRSARSNVCDVCAIYQSRMKGGSTAEATEELGQHTEFARRMRKEYKADKRTASSEDPPSDTAVIVMDFSQNLSVPSVSTTPSQWYFCSLINVNVFGIYYENEAMQTNNVYDETTSGKGSEQINSMLHHFIRTVIVPSGKKKLIVYADNCSGQNKNNPVIKFMLAQVQMKILDRIDYKFFVKGHTKNSCDRGFGHIRKHIARQDLWTIGHVVNAVKDSASSNATVHISRGDNFFMGYKAPVTELYKTLLGVQQFQIFTMDSSKPGIVKCRRGPDEAVEEQDLRRKIDGVLTNETKVERMFTHYLKPLSLPPINPEKIHTMHHTVRAYVPEEFQSDPIYRAPTVEQGANAKTAKQSRREHEAAMAVAAKENADRRGRNVAAEEAQPSKKKRKTSCTRSAVV